MDNPTLVLGVDLMDRDHLRLERLFAAVAQTGDDDLPKLHRDVAAEVAAHFAREEALMRERQVPGLHCHVSQHNVLVGETARDDSSGDRARLRRRLGVVLPQLILAHVATMDRLAAAYLGGTITRSQIDALRLPLPGPAE